MSTKDTIHHYRGLLIVRGWKYDRGGTVVKDMNRWRVLDSRGSTYLVAKTIKELHAEIDWVMENAWEPQYHFPGVYRWKVVAYGVVLFMASDSDPRAAVAA